MLSMSDTSAARAVCIGYHKCVAPGPPGCRLRAQGSRDKVTNLDVHIDIKEEVPKRQITMDHLMGVHVMAGANELCHKESRFRLCEDTMTVKHVHERPIGTELQSHVDVLFILEAVDEPNDVGVV